MYSQNSTHLKHMPLAVFLRSLADLFYEDMTVYVPAGTYKKPIKTRASKIDHRLRFFSLPYRVITNIGRNFLLVELDIYWYLYLFFKPTS